MRRFCLVLILCLCLQLNLYGAPCYGTRMPKKNKFFMGTQTHSLIKRELRNNYGRVKSLQHFLLLSYGVFDWLSIDLKGGAGDVKHKAVSGQDIDYSTGFAGGYGIRLKVYNGEKFDAVFGFQHISVHPKNTHVDSIKNKTILDDWQVSLLGSYDLGWLTPYLGAKFSRVDYIHWVEDDRKRKMSDRTRSVGVVAGFDIPLNDKWWINLEGQFIDGTAASISINHAF